MVNILRLIGIILILVPVGLFWAVNQGIEGTPLASVAQMLSCSAGDTLVEFPSESSNLPWDYYCQTEAGERAEKSQEVYTLLALVGGFVAFDGMTMLAIAYMRSRKAVYDETIYHESFTVDSGFQPVQGFTTVVMDGQQANWHDLSPEQQQKVQDAMSKLESLGGLLGDVTSQMSQAFTLKGESLAERLTELQEARERGLISQDEYDRIRQAILDRQDD